MTVFADGEIDAANAKEFAVAVCDAVAGAERVTLDLSGLEFIAIDGVAALHAINAHLTRAGVPWCVLPGPAASRVLGICDREHVIPLLQPAPSARRGETVLRLVQSN
ncbi:STAS domain-containing protein [Mycolicibacterium rutilum]|uniref:STAS domain-containing protein n=1 Tax=Mycolicibacterium rutilum TaxID=370526 RepID=UPI0012FF5DA1|nr:STAS domain-containing protein [Mycolicibacterium rutilum]